MQPEEVEVPIDLTDQMRHALENALKDRCPVLVASASAAGMPDIVYKGSVMVWDREHLAFWERSRGQTMRNLQENPQICLLYANPEARIGWKFFGEAQVLQDGDLRGEIMAQTTPMELDKDPDRKGAAVLIRVNRVLQAGQVLMER